MRAVAILLLVVALCLPAFAYPHDYLYRYPEPTVMIRSSISPEVLMPGDTGVVSIEVENGADQYVVSYQKEDFFLAMHVYVAELCGSEGIEVTCAPYEDVGSIGPGDTITLYYTIEADENITDGNHFLDFRLVGGYEEDQRVTNRRIHVKVDSSDVILIKAETDSSNGVSLDVANPRQNTLNAVSIVPEGDGVTFTPEEYYIGTMDPDEMFTVDFDISTNKSLADLGFWSRFKNGDTWHESDVYTMSSGMALAMGPGNDRGGDGPIATAGMIGSTAVLLLVAIGGFYVWHKRSSRP